MKETRTIPILFFEYEGASQATGISVPALMDLVKAGEIPHLVRPGDRVIFPITALMEWFSVQREGSGSARIARTRNEPRATFNGPILSIDFYRPMRQPLNQARRKMLMGLLDTTGDDS